MALSCCSMSVSVPSSIAFSWSLPSSVSASAPTPLDAPDPPRAPPPTLLPASRHESPEKSSFPSPKTFSFAFLCSGFCSAPSFASLNSPPWWRCPSLPTACSIRASSARKFSSLSSSMPPSSSSTTLLSLPLPTLPDDGPGTRREYAATGCCALFDDCRGANGSRRFAPPLSADEGWANPACSRKSMNSAARLRARWSFKASLFSLLMLARSSILMSAAAPVDP
mmetsp:Transcript_48135/g.96928  ORF Transcript_48135/g.96928 Transcript_48135/m.96928 type:complete len:224 (-) Transcript_48135:453-1124(-)